ncbi:hypothetical protein OIE66_19125 [Nonomuraea sp. NBC_01738]|uniref:hypothetical protein n=1 Tax=Nonomuraea sp. NBC_01738 TaxID=2976003 RepID=UPI002E126507|nr:hypothetical protein OIE66_19125 [Nonomuraea sp. NBC_01738]
MRLRTASIVAALLCSVAVILPAGPAQAVSCTKGWSPDLHTAWIDCDNGFTTGMFRLKALFCTNTGCAWRFGPNRYYQGGGQSSHTDSIWVDTSSITYEDMGPGSLTSK